MSTVQEPALTPEAAVAGGGDGGRAARGRPKLFNSEALRVLGPLLVAMVVIALYTNSRNDQYLTSTNIENIFLQSSVLGIVAIGQTYLIAAGMLDLSVGSLASLTSVLAARMLVGGGSEWWVFVAVIGFGALIGLAWGLIVALLRVPPFILTLGGLSVFSSLALVWSKSSPVPVRTNFLWLKNQDLFGIRWPIALFLIVLVVSVVVMRYTRFGRHLYALGSSEEAAYLAGLPTLRTKVLAFVISSGLVGLAGLILMARVGAGDPRVGAGLELRAIAAVVLGGATLAGGRGTPIGTFVGVVLLGVVGTALTFNDVPGAYQDMVFGGVLIFAVVTTALSERRRDRSASRRTLQTLLGRPAATPGGAGRPS